MKRQKLEILTNQIFLMNIDQMEHIMSFWIPIMKVFIKKIQKANMQGNEFSLITGKNISQ